MKQTFQRVLALSLCLLLCAALLPGSVWAAEVVDSGTCGDNLTWTLDSGGTLIISGTGKMKDYFVNSAWYGKRRSVNTVEIRSGVTRIGENAFSACSNLTSVSIPDSVTSIGGAAFQDCASLTSVSIPDSVTSIDYNAFRNCSSLTSVTIPDSVTSIGDMAFHGCKNLLSVSIPDSVTSIGGSAFDETPWLQSLGEFAIFNHTLLRYQGDETDVTIPNDVTSIGNMAFYGCNSVTHVSIPDSVTSIGSDAFYACHGLTSVSIPDSVTSIGDGAFNGCENLTSVTIPDSVTSIGDGAFGWCTGLTSISISNNVTNIGGLLRCSSLTSISIPNSVTSINGGEFAWCDSLKSVTIPNSVTSIGGAAFLECNSLTDIYFTGTEQEWKAMEIGEFNEPLQNAAIHFNSTGPSVVLSPQNLTVNGVSRDVEKYNIDGYNYFKLRDIAYLLNGTHAQFSVEWDAEANAARVVSGQPYAANGSELVIGADRSATAVRSPQTIVINGDVRSDLSAFNLAGNNFFKLRDLGDALGFQVDYDAATNTAVVTTG